jgi:pimeloyl-ACP methyl ester carboxylesterase
MQQPTSHYVRCCDREIHFVEWGRKGAPPLLMAHGLARTGRDFDDLAEVLADTYHIVCWDMIGRGLSQWSPDPDNEYRLDFFARIAKEFADQVGFAQMRWVGTSMGGAIGMVAGATTLKGRISHLVINDSAPSLAPPAIERIKAYAGSPPEFDTVRELETYLRTVYKPYGWQSDAQWRRMAETSVRRLPNGKITTHYDPNMVRQFRIEPNDYEIWQHYDALTMPMLTLRGVDSDLVLQETAEEMTRRGPRTKLVIVPDCGHAPCLNVPEQIKVVSDFLAQ